MTNTCPITGAPATHHDLPGHGAQWVLVRTDAKPEGYVIARPLVEQIMWPQNSGARKLAHALATGRLDDGGPGSVLLVAREHSTGMIHPRYVPAAELESVLAQCAGDQDVPAVREPAKSHGINIASAGGHVDIDRNSFTGIPAPVKTAGLDSLSAVGNFADQLPANRENDVGNDQDRGPMFETGPIRGKADLRDNKTTGSRMLKSDGMGSFTARRNEAGGQLLPDAGVKPNWFVRLFTGFGKGVLSIARAIIPTIVLHWIGLK